MAFGTFMSFTMIFLLAASVLALVSAIAASMWSKRGALELLWMVFCGSIACAMLKFAIGAEVGAYQHVLGMGAAFTCNGFWLVSRALLRPKAAITPSVLGFALSISGMVIAYHLLLLIQAFSADTALQSSIKALGALLDLLGPGVLVLTAYDMLAGYHSLSAPEQKQRRLLLSIYASCVLLTTVAPSLTSDPVTSLIIRELLVALSACSILVLGNVLIRWRKRHPISSNDQLPIDIAVSTKPPREAEVINDDVLWLAPKIETAMRHAKLYLDPELKVADLADALHAPEYKITRALTAVLMQKNFNQYVNRFRVEHAKALLSDHANRAQILQIALSSGFASLGPFNRAFKAQVEMTPSEWRARTIAAPLELVVQAENL
jgi:AraC-like DNA-binding protein